jgi:DNA polymerase-3 subunit alpha
MDKLLSYIIQINKDESSSQDNLFGLLPEISVSRLRLEEAEPIDKKQKLNWEREYLGLYVSEHPMSQLRPLIKDHVIDCSRLKHCVGGSEVRVAGVITTVKKIQTKKGDSMLFVKIEDNRGDVEILVFPKVLEQDQHLWREDNIIICSGKISEKDEETKILCDWAWPLSEHNLAEVLQKIATGSRSTGRSFYRRSSSVAAPIEKVVSLTIAEPVGFEVSRQLKTAIYDYPGMAIVEIIVNKKNGLSQKIKTSFRVNYNDQFVLLAEGLLGQGKVALN